MRRYIIILLIIFTCLSCGKKSPVDPAVDSESTEPGRFGVDFTIDVSVFPDIDEIDPGIFYDADISEIVQGPGYFDTGMWGTLWTDTDDHQWAVAVALREGEFPGSGERQICYRFLRDDGVMSGVDEIGSPGRIRFARVAACYFYTFGDGYDDNPWYTNVEVGIVYEKWFEEYNEWRVCLWRLIFRPEMFVTGYENPNPYYGHAVSFNPPDSVLDGYGQIMPDIAYDPRSTDLMDGNGKGDIYIVMTYYDPAAGGPRVYVKYCYRSGPHYDEIIFNENSEPELIQEWHAFYGEWDLGICYGYHPRIDIGEVTFFPALGPPWNVTDWHVVVVFTADNGVFGPHFSFWPAGFLDEDHWDSDSFIELPLRFAPYTTLTSAKAGFMPTVDIGPPGTDLCAFTWTQATSESWNEVVVGYVDSNFGLCFFNEDEILTKDYLESYAFPSVSVLSDDDDKSYANISYLHSENPSSLNWDARVVQIETDYNNPHQPVCQLGTHFMVAPGVYGDYDSGSAYSNWYGFSSSSAILTDMGNGYFWTLWSSFGEEPESQSNLNSVWGAWGYTLAP